MDETLLDTDILNEVLKQKNAHVLRHAADYLAQHGRFAISSMTRYELLRGLKEKQAAAQLANFQVFCQHTFILSVTDSILDQAAELWAQGRAQGLAPKDADLIIAATALQQGRTLVSGNTTHFAWIPGLALANWRDP
ncbi:MAG: type II toxin-antitoxin system VapC family toxin [Pirellulaceae bacterium]